MDVDILQRGSEHAVDSRSHMRQIMVSAMTMAGELAGAVLHVTGTLYKACPSPEILGRANFEPVLQLPAYT